MGIKTYRIIKATTQLAGVAAGVYAMSLGADPLTTFVIIGSIVGGPEVVEALLVNASGDERK